MAQQKQTLGQAIDQVIVALEALDKEARKTALLAVCAHLGIAIDQGSTSLPAITENVSSGQPVSPPPPTPKPPASTDIRTLKEQKKPKSAQQMSCLVAYYLQEHAPEAEKKDSVSIDDMIKYFKQAGFRLPKQMKQLLKDAKRAGYFDSGARGEYKLNPVGYNLVAYGLPSEKGNG
ncbi:MAG: hypothetical protein ACYTBZ_12100 [Planctomycetota bacterium]|jgi:hypothetical protein